MELEKQAKSVDIKAIHKNLLNCNLKEAEQQVFQHLESYPNDLLAIETLADIYELQKKFSKALIQFRLLKDEKFNNPYYWARIENLLNMVEFCPEIEEDLITFIELPFKDKSNLNNKINKYCSTMQDIPLEKNHIFLTSIACITISSPGIEELLIFKRKENLANLMQKRIDQFNFSFMLAMSFQAYYCEYIYYVQPNEAKHVQQLLLSAASLFQLDAHDSNIRVCLVTACTYTSLFEILKEYPSLRDYCATDPEIKKLFKLQIESHEQEQEIKTHIKSLTAIDDEISKKVRMQYEEHPYPRWSSCQIQPQISLAKLMANVLPKVKLATPEKPNILIAGCGTGKQTLQASNIINKKLVNIDLSLSSMAYAIRKSQELGFKNFEFYHADLTRLNDIKDKFDYIECVGVLHHTASIENSFASIMSCLKSKGILRIGLYSKTARQQLSFTYDLVKKYNLDDSLNSLRKLRYYILNNREEPELKWLCQFRDFYTASMAIDLIMHKQELRADITLIKKICKKHNLRFLGFAFPKGDPTLECYAREYPLDKTYTNLDNWDEFEQKHPNTFSSMYNFYLQHRGI